MAKIQTQWEMCGSNFTADWKNIPHKHSTPAVCNMNNLSFLTLKTNIRKHYFSLTLWTYTKRVIKYNHSFVLALCRKVMIQKLKKIVKSWCNNTCFCLLPFTLKTKILVLNKFLTKKWQKSLSYFLLNYVFGKIQIWVG